MKKQKYRIIEQSLNTMKNPWIQYVIEKRKRFLFWSWWSQDYLFDRIYCCYEYDTLEEAQNQMLILTGKKQAVTKKVMPNAT